MRWLGRLLLFVVAAGLALAAFAWAEARRTPEVARYAVELADWPVDVPPLRIVQLSDVHVALPKMSPERVTRIVAEVNALRPDLIVLTGDFVSDREPGMRSVPTAAAIAPLAALRAPLGTYAVLGNHDNKRPTGPFRQAMRRAGIALLENRSVGTRRATVAGVGDLWSNGADIRRALEGASAEPGRPLLLLSHNPDVFPDVPPHVTLTIAGHTHGGQIAPWPIGPIWTASSYGRRYARGLIVEKGRRMIVSSGLGTSNVPLRLGVPPELTLVTLGPPARPGRARRASR